MVKKNEKIQIDFKDFFVKIFKEKFVEIEDVKFDFSSNLDLQVLYESNMTKIINKDLIKKDARYFFDYVYPCIFVNCYN